MQDTLPIHFAPLQGYTEAIYRNAHDAFFGGVDTYYTPFVRLEKGNFRRRDVRGIEPENNGVTHLIPAIRRPYQVYDSLPTVSEVRVFPNHPRTLSH